ncbi:MAG: hypothetical protein Q9208_000639 [Pyrenodesmia sp. 3 TL-2023]
MAPRLPPELLAQISRHLVSPHISNLPGSVEASTSFDINILYTCRALFEEASKIFYQDHLFVRARLPDCEDIRTSIACLCLTRTERKKTDSCARMVMTVDVNYRDFTKDQLGSFDIVLAHQDMDMLIHLLNYVDLFTSDTMSLEIAVNNLYVSKSIFINRLLKPFSALRLIFSFTFDVRNARDIVDRSIRDVLLHWPFPNERYVASQQSLIKLLERHLLSARVELATRMTLCMVDYLMSLFPEGSASSKLTDLFNSRILLEAYLWSINIRNFTYHGVRHCGAYFQCCDAIQEYQRSDRLAELYRNFGLYLQAVANFEARSMELSWQQLEEVVASDLGKELGLSLQQVLTAKTGDPASSEFSQFSQRLNKSLEFAELDKVFHGLVKAAQAPGDSALDLDSLAEAVEAL